MSPAPAEVRPCLASPKSRTFAWPRFVDEDVRGLDVAVHDAAGVGGLEGIGDLRAEIEQRLELERARPEPVPQRLALEQLHRDEGLALVLVDVVDRADVGVLERGGRAGFALQPLERLGVARQLLGRNFSATRRPSFRSSAS